MGVRSTVTRNTLFNGAGRVWDGVLGLVLTAYIFLKLGAGEYGLWGVAGAFIGYAALFDLGIGSAYAKYIAEHAERDEKGAISSVVSTGFFLYLVLGAAFVVGGWLLLDGALEVLSRFGPEALKDLSDERVIDDLRFLIRWGLVLFAASSCVAPFTAVQTGLQRMGITNVISVVASLVKVIGTVLFLELGYGVRGLLYSNAVVMAVFAILSVCAAFYLHPELRISVAKINVQTFSQLFQFGWRTQVSRLSNLIMFETDVLVIALVLRDLELAGLYKIGVELANKMRQVPAIMLSALLPAASQLDAREEHDKVRQLYWSATKYVAAVAIPMSAFLAIEASPILKTWIAGEIDLSVSILVVQIMAVGYVTNMLAGAGVTIALGKGRADLQMYAGLISMTSNIVLTIALVYTFGFWGIPVATVISMLVSWVWFTGALGKEVQVPMRRIIEKALVWPLLAVIPGLIVCGIAEVLGASLEGRLANGILVLGTWAVMSASYLFFIRWTPFLDHFDLEFLDDALGLKRFRIYRLWSQRLRQH